jgi:HEPN domain-containing protein
MDFLRAALQRLDTAEFLFRSGYTLDAQYLGGYAVECSLKALILHLCPPQDRETMLQDISSGARMHRPEVLLGLVRALDVELPPESAKRMRRFDWSTEMRYSTGRRDLGETKAFLKTVKLITDWVQEQMT